MKLSKESEYGLNGLVHLARQRPGSILTLRAIAEAGGLPERFLAKTFQKLARSGVLRSHRGRKRGYALSRPSPQISVKEILEAIEGPDIFTRCVFWSNEKTARVLGWIVVLLPIALILFALGPRRWDLLSTLGILFVPLWVGLYPVNGLATAGTYAWLAHVLPHQPGPLNAVAAAAALVVFVATHRLEHTLARNATDRVSRHVVRLGVFGLAAYAQFLRYALTTTP